MADFALSPECKTSVIRKISKSMLSKTLVWFSGLFSCFITFDSKLVFDIQISIGVPAITQLLV